MSSIAEVNATLDREVERTLNRAYDLAASGECADLAAIRFRLQAEGYARVLTELSRRIVRRELREICERSARARSR